MEEVQELELQERLLLWDTAAEAAGALGEVEARLGRTEADLRVYVHDALAPHHDKDFKYLAALPMRCLEAPVLRVRP
eukprot:8489015-Lingulodinium_polyedra.AAC.1